MEPAVQASPRKSGGVRSAIDVRIGMNLGGTHARRRRDGLRDRRRENELGPRAKRSTGPEHMWSSNSEVELVLMRYYVEVPWERRNIAQLDEAGASAFVSHLVQMEDQSKKGPNNTPYIGQQTRRLSSYIHRYPSIDYNTPLQLICMHALLVSHFHLLANITIPSPTICKFRPKRGTNNQTLNIARSLQEVSSTRSHVANQDNTQESLCN